MSRRWAHLGAGPGPGGDRDRGGEGPPQRAPPPPPAVQCCTAGRLPRPTSGVPSEFEGSGRHPQSTWEGRPGPRARLQPRRQTQ